MNTLTVHSYAEFESVISKPIPAGGLRLEWLEAGSDHPTVFKLDETALPFMDDHWMKPLKRFWKETSDRKTRQKPVKLETDSVKHQETKKPVFQGDVIAMVRVDDPLKRRCYYLGTQMFAKVDFFATQFINEVEHTPAEFWLYRHGSFTIHKGKEAEADSLVLEMAEKITKRKMSIEDTTFQGAKTK